MFALEIGQKQKYFQNMVPKQLQSLKQGHTNKTNNAMKYKKCDKQDHTELQSCSFV